MTISLQTPAQSAGRQLEHAELLEMLRRELDVTQSENKIIAVLMLELRRVNRLGAITGGPHADVIFEHARLRLERLLRDTDRYARISSEQICLVLPRLVSSAQSVLAAVKILTALQKPYGVDNQSVLVRPHIGIATFPEEGQDSDQLLMFADIAARIATTQEEGYHIYRAEDHVETEVYRGIDVALARAIKANEIQVHFQPQIEIASRRCLSAEALLRWSAPGGRAIPAGTLVGMAENTGQIGPLTLRVLNTALRNIAEFERAGVSVSLSVNLSTRTLADPEFPDVVQQCLQTWSVNAERLTFEITEGSMIRDAEGSLKMLVRLRDLGVRLSIDDFGTGYSSLAYLQRFPLNELKIDKIFVQNMRKTRGDRQIVRSVIDLAHNFDLRAVAEGVEDQETFDLLRELGCDLVQGFLFSRALPDSEFIEWYRRHEGAL